MSEVRKRYKEIDSLKGFAIFLVVLGHAIIYFPVNLHEVPWCEVLFTMLSGIHMPLFFAISGFCFSYRGKYWDFLFKKIKRLVFHDIVRSLRDLSCNIQMASGLKTSPVDNDCLLCASGDHQNTDRSIYAFSGKRLSVFLSPWRFAQNQQCQDFRIQVVESPQLAAGRGGDPLDCAAVFSVGI